MSFPKARLRRFNEEIPQVPSPGRYDPKLESNVKGAVMPTSKRFPGQTTTSSSLDNIERASTASSGVVFRTPQVLRKVPLTPRLQHLKEKTFDTSGSDILSSDERPCVKSALKKTVSKADYRRLEDELNSLTDKYHKILLEKEIEINNLKEEINDIKIHEEELKTILQEKSQLASDRHKETLQLKDNLDMMVEKINVDREEHQRFINDLKLKISDLQNKKYELETVLAEKQSVIVTINDKYSDLEVELKSLQEENLLLEQANSCILMGAEEKFEQLETREISKLETFLESLDVKYEKEGKQFQTKMNFFVHEFNLKSKEKIDHIRQSQEKVKELEKLLDKKVKEFSEGIKEADERCKYLYREFCKVEKERDELLESDLEKKLALLDVRKKSDIYKSELEECRITCRKYQITLNTMNQTVTALSERLFESEKEVERLNVVEIDLEYQKQLLEEKSQLLLSDIAALRKSMDKMEEEIIKDVYALKEDLETKADLFKEEAVKTEQLLNSRICEKQYAINILLNENEYFKKEIERKDEEFLKREKKNEERINKLKYERSKLEEELSEKLSAQKNVHTILNKKLESANLVISDLQSIKSQQESHITNLFDQIKELKEASMSHERAYSEQTIKIQSLQSEIERKKEVEIKQKQYIDNLISDSVLEKERCEAVKIEKNNIEYHLHAAELNIAKKSEEINNLLNCVESLKQSLKICEEKVSAMKDEKEVLKQQLIVAEDELEKLKSDNFEGQIELQRQITDLKCQLGSAKEKMKTEIPKLERDNINKAENILELNLSIDSLKEEIELQKRKILCCEAEKNSLHNLMEEMKSQICDFEKVIQDKKLEINALNEEHIRKDALCQDLLSQLDSMSSVYNKQNEDMRQNAENALKLIEADEKISDLELQLTGKDKEIDILTQRISELKDALQLDEVHLLKEQLEELTVKYDAAVEERDRLGHEVGNLMGHQNINQKIKKVAELKQYNIELRDENDLLRSENLRLKAKLENYNKKQAENKENVSVPRREDKPKVSKPGSAKKKPMSPGILKPTNY